MDISDFKRECIQHGGRILVESPKYGIVCEVFTEKAFEEISDKAGYYGTNKVGVVELDAPKKKMSVIPTPKGNDVFEELIMRVLPKENIEEYIYEKTRDEDLTRDATEIFAYHITPKKLKNHPNCEVYFNYDTNMVEVECKKEETLPEGRRVSDLFSEREKEDIENEVMNLIMDMENKAIEISKLGGW